MHTAKPAPEICIPRVPYNTPAEPVSKYCAVDTVSPAAMPPFDAPARGKIMALKRVATRVKLESPRVKRVKIENDSVKEEFVVVASAPNVEEPSSVKEEFVTVESAPKVEEPSSVKIETF